MSNPLPDDLPFDDWITHLFDHPESETPWYYAFDHAWWDAARQPRRAVDYLTRLFSQPSSRLASFTNDQIGHGLWFLFEADPAYTSAIVNLENPVPMDDRLRCIASMVTFFSDLFAGRCASYLGHLETSSSWSPEHNQLNMACYMWWDMFGGYPLVQTPGSRRITEACLDVMEATLRIDSLPCRESALHGLGHWHSYAPERVERIIDGFLKNTPNISGELRRYALAARTGCVL
ncbi:MAG: hypothetical protein JNM70_16920 [Anaerolineae bacterium]|nr:hypothetical protein [Anaerolineae bacterium]